MGFPLKSQEISITLPLSKKEVAHLNLCPATCLDAALLPALGNCGTLYTVLGGFDTFLCRLEGAYLGTLQSAKQFVGQDDRQHPVVQYLLNALSFAPKAIPHYSVVSEAEHPALFTPRQKRYHAGLWPMAYKDSLFRSIFGNEKSALALYNAVHGTSHDARDTDVVMNTLNETLWTPRKNDLSFLINRSLVVVAEHQSTINYNMPYRMLQYVCRLFENGINDRKAVYRQALVRHARPRFIVLLNGTLAFPDHQRMRLSDSFEQVAGFDGVTLELEIDVYNVNEGRNSSIIEASKELKGYAYFVSRVRVHERELVALGEAPVGEEKMKTAIRLAIRDCKDAGLLREFWENMSQEELNMLVNEWDMKTALEVREEEGFERGIERGIERGVETVAANALAEGASIEFVHKITGLDVGAIAELAAD